MIAECEILAAYSYILVTSLTPATCTAASSGSMPPSSRRSLTVLLCLLPPSPSFLIHLAPSLSLAIASCGSGLGGFVSLCLCGDPLRRRGAAPRQKKGTHREPAVVMVRWRVALAQRRPPTLPTLAGGGRRLQRDGDGSGTNERWSMLPHMMHECMY